jgi:CRP/FNR family transcriptional regulator, cyclic AMP receptor protein
MSGDALDRHAALRASPLLREFTDVGIRIISEACEHRVVGPGTCAFRAGEVSAGLGFVARGSLQLLPREGGSPLGELGPGDTYGGLSLIQPGEHLLTGMAPNDVDVLVLTHQALDALEKNNPRTALKLRLAISADLADRLREAKGPLREFLVWQVSRRQGG